MIPIIKHFFLQEDDYYTDYENGEGNNPDYPDSNQNGSGPPRNFQKCYNSYGTQKTLRYSKVGISLILSCI